MPLTYQDYARIKKYTVDYYMALNRSIIITFHFGTVITMRPEYALLTEIMAMLAFLTFSDRTYISTL